MKARAQIAAAAHCLTAQGNHMERGGIIVPRPAGVQAVVRTYAEIVRRALRRQPLPSGEFGVYAVRLTLQCMACITPTFLRFTDGRLKIFFDFRQPFGIHLAAEFVFHAADETLQTPQPQSGRTRHLRQPLRPQHHERNNAGQQHLAETEVEHGLGLLIVFVSLGLLLGRAGIRLFRSIIQAFFEVVHRAAQIFADVASFFGTEYQHYNQQHNQPMRNSAQTHFKILTLNLFNAETRFQTA